MQKKDLFLTLIIVLIIAGALGFAFYKSGGYSYLRGEQEKAPAEIKTEEKNQVITGVISDINKRANLITLTKKDFSEINLLISSETKILNLDNEEADLDYLQKGFSALAVVSFANGNSADLFVLRILKEPNIIVFSPLQNSDAENPIIVKGVARVFENTFNYELTDENGIVLSKNSLMASSSDTGLYGSFEVSIPYSVPISGQKIFLEVFDYSARDGAKQDSVLIPLNLKRQ